jgi:hypothetical protein
VIHKHLGDADPDAAVIRALSRLGSLSPGPGFSDRVMSRVRLPEPRSVALMTRAVRWAREPRRAFMLAGGYAVSAAAALVALVPWLLQNVSAIRLGLDWAGGLVLRLIGDGAVAATSWTLSSGVAEWFSSISLGGTQVVLVFAAGGSVYAGCAALLHVLLRAPRSGGGGSHASVQA